MLLRLLLLLDFLLRLKRMRSWGQHDTQMLFEGILFKMLVSFNVRTYFAIFRHFRNSNLFWVGWDDGHVVRGSFKALAHWFKFICRHLHRIRLSIQFLELISALRLMLFVSEILLKLVTFNLNIFLLFVTFRLFLDFFLKNLHVLLFALLLNPFFLLFFLSFHILLYDLQSYQFLFP